MVAAVLACVAAASASALTFPRGRATIDTGERRVAITVELAVTSAQRGRGLMYRTRLAPDAGMAFLWTEPVRGSFWMKNTRIPLSVAFWDARGRIVRLLDMAPCRADPCPLYDPGVPYVGALEVNRGAFRRWGVERGDRIAVSRR